MDDFAASADLWAQPEVVRYITGVPSTPEQSWSRLLRYIGHWALLGNGYWLIEERATGAFVGEAGFADYHRQIEPSLDRIPELGWVITPEKHNQGYATEAVRAALEWGALHFGTGAKTGCIIAPENYASIRVAEKCGFAFAAQTTYQGLPTLMYLRELR